MEASDTILSVRNLSTEFFLKRGILRAVDRISFDLARGEVVGLVGESGCGKSITSKSVLRLVRRPGISTGEVYFHPSDRPAVNLIDLKPMGDEIRRIRGKYINMI